MSKNFELLKQIEVESGITDSRDLDCTARFAKERFSPGGGSNAWQQEILRLVQRVFLSADEAAPRMVVFCGVDDKSGSSSVCARAGRTLAIESSRPVCVVNANVRSSQLARIFAVDTTAPFPGKSESVHDRCVRIDGNLWLAGVDMLFDDRGALRSVEELKQRLAQMRGEFEYVLIDAPGTNICGNAAILGRVADAAILVVEANSTRRLTARRAKENLDAAGVRLLGTVLHNRSFPIPKSIYNRL
jgi:receptor protein-tyrosine kinase